MKNLKSLIASGILAGSLVFGGCGDKKAEEDSNKLESKKIEKQPTELEKFNLENTQVYDDFFEFCIENPNKKMYAEKQYKINLPNNNSIDFTEDKSYSHIHINEKDFYENDGDKLLDFYVFKNENTGLIKSEHIKSMPQEKQFSLAKEYTETLKKIMREEKFKNY